MQTHSDADQELHQQMARLEQRASLMSLNKQSEITAGKPDEPILDKWEADTMDFIQRPDDEQEICRISIGGGISWANVEYCVFRGDRTKCAYLLEKAARALRQRSSTDRA